MQLFQLFVEEINKNVDGCCRPDTFSLGVCNGCQLMALLGWVPGAEEAQAGTSGRLPDLAQPRFVHNTSGRFESRWATVTVLPGSPAVLLKVSSASAPAAHSNLVEHPRAAHILCMRALMNQAASFAIS